MKNLLRILFISLLMFSCSSELDFEQAEDLVLTPVIVGNLAVTDFDATEFLSSGAEITEKSDELLFEIFQDSRTTDNLNKAELFFEFTNSINRDYVVNIIFKDVNLVPIYEIPTVVPANKNVTKKELFEKATLDILFSTETIAFVVTMLPGPPLTPSSTGNIKMRSNATLYFTIK